MPATIVIPASEHIRELNPGDEPRRVTGALAGPQDQGVALTACSTQRCDAIPRASARQLKSRMQGDPSA
jgi:hypothetical protein